MANGEWSLKMKASTKETRVRLKSTRENCEPVRELIQDCFVTHTDWLFEPHQVYHVNCRSCKQKFQSEIPVVLLREEEYVRISEQENEEEEFLSSVRQPNATFLFFHVENQNHERQQVATIS